VSGHRAHGRPSAARKELIVARRPLPTRRLSEQPDFDQLKRQAKELFDAFKAGAPAADAEVRVH
jgi:hypothetical protein